MTGNYLGLNYYEMILRCAIGESAKDYYDMRTEGADCVLTRQLFSLQRGVIRDIKVENDSSIKQLELFVKKGDSVSKFTNSRDCIGKALCVGNDIEECNRIMNNFIENKLIVEID